MAEVIRANISRPYLIRLGVVSLFSLCLALWCVYDGLVTYPDQIQRATKYIELLDEALQPIRADADAASRDLSVPVGPTQWDGARWNQNIQEVLRKHEDSTTAEQNKFFLQITWLYLNLQNKLQQLEPNELDAQSLSRYLQNVIDLRKRIITILDDSAESTASDDAIHQTHARLTATWDTAVKKNHWPHEYPKEPKNPYAIDQQFYMSAGIVPFSLFFLFALFRNRGRWIEGDSKGLRNSRGVELSYDQIEALDKKRWDKKGIAKVRFSDGNRNSIFVLDDCNYEYQPIRDILRRLESTISRDKIHGGNPEPPHNDPHNDPHNEAVQEKNASDE